MDLQTQAAAHREELSNMRMNVSDAIRELESAADLIKSMAREATSTTIRLACESVAGRLETRADTIRKKVFPQNRA